MKIKGFDMAIVDWLEELPLDEIANEDCRMMISEFREGFIGVTEAIALLENDFCSEVEEWVKTNNFLNSLVAEEE